METEELVAALRDPSAYPDGPATIELRETHISYVFLTEERAYKLKKPVDLGFLDYTTLRRRGRMCRREVELNRRLAPDVYLGVERVTRRSGGVRIGGPGRAVDYVVVMRRLPDARTLGALVAADAVEPEHIHAIAATIATFHTSGPPAPELRRFGRPRAIARNLEENFDQTRPYVGTLIASATYEEICAASRGFLERNHPLFRRRIEDERIRDGHGDLRCDHVYLYEGVQIVDCIEFNDRFRYGDTASDLAFLAMDLDAGGAPDLAALLVERYIEESGDDLRDVLPFYQGYRAFVRAKVAAFRVSQLTEPGDAALQASLSARRYFHAALRYARGEERPLLALVAGLSGTGKSTLAGGLATVLGTTTIASDPTRKRLAGLGVDDARPDAIGAGLYAPEVTAGVYATMLEAAETALRRGRSVVLDATFGSRGHRERAKALARRLGCRFVAVECVADDEVVRERLAERASGGPSWSDGRWEVYLSQRASFEPLDELPRSERVVVDAATPPGDQVAAIVAHVEQPW